MSRFLAPLVVALAVPALAQTSTTTTGNSPPAPTSTGLPSLVQQLPVCAVPCFNSGAQAIGCAVTDLSCICDGGNLASLSTSIATCLGSLDRSDNDDDDDDSGITCALGDLNDLAQLAAGICIAVNANPPQSQLDQASSIISDKLSSASITPTGTGAGPANTGTGSTPTDGTKPNGAVKVEGVARGVLVAVAAYLFVAF